MHYMSVAKHMRFYLFILKKSKGQEQDILAFAPSLRLTTYIR